MWRVSWACRFRVYIGITRCPSGNLTRSSRRLVSEGGGHIRQVTWSQPRYKLVITNSLERTSIHKLGPYLLIPWLIPNDEGRRLFVLLGKRGELTVYLVYRTNSVADDSSNLRSCKQVN